MLNKRVLLDMGAWLQGIVTTLVPYATEAFPAVVVALEPDRWLLQVQQAGYMQFDHRLAKVMGSHLLTDGDHLILPALYIPIKDLTSVIHRFQQVFCGSRGDEHVGQGAAAHLGGDGLPASKVWSDLRTSPETFGFPTLFPENKPAHF